MPPCVSLVRSRSLPSYPDTDKSVIFWIRPLPESNTNRVLVFTGLHRLKTFTSRKALPCKALRADRSYSMGRKVDFCGVLRSA